VSEAEKATLPTIVAVLPAIVKLETAQATGLIIVSDKSLDTIAALTSGDTVGALPLNTIVAVKLILLLGSPVVMLGCGATINDIKDYLW